MPRDIRAEILAAWERILERHDVAPTTARALALELEQAALGRGVTLARPVPPEDPAAADQLTLPDPGDHGTGYQAARAAMGLQPKAAPMRIDLSLVQASALDETAAGDQWRIAEGQLSPTYRVLLERGLIEELEPENGRVYCQITERGLEILAELDERGPAGIALRPIQLEALRAAGRDELVFAADAGPVSYGDPGIDATAAVNYLVIRGFLTLVHGQDAADGELGAALTAKGQRVLEANPERPR